MALGLFNDPYLTGLEREVGLYACVHVCNAHCFIFRRTHVLTLAHNLYTHTHTVAQ